MVVGVSSSTVDLDVGQMSPPTIPPPPIPWAKPSKMKLDRVLGLTTSNSSSFSCHPESNLVAYLAGCVVVILDIKKNRQVGHIVNTSKKQLTSLSFSQDGRHIVTGESGHQPSVRVWEIKTCTQVVEFENGHKYGVTCVAFSPSAPFVVSVGSQHDMVVNVWDWKLGVKIASNKVSAKVKSISFAQDGSYFVTVGVRHVKFWYLSEVNSSKRRSASSSELVPLMGRSAILSDQRNNTFCDVGCGKGSMSSSTFAITESGLLCEFNSRRLLDKWVELRTTHAYSLRVGVESIVIGCSEGVIRVFNPTNLHFVCTLPRPHVLGVDVAKGQPVIENGSDESPKPKYPDCVGVTLIEESSKVVSIYSDHSMYVWDVKDPKRIGKSHSYLYHSSCIWGIELFKGSQLLPTGTFITCSSDDTIRFWNLDLNQSMDGYVFQRNIFSYDLLKVIYMDPDLKYLSDPEMTQVTSMTNGSSNDDQSASASYDGKNGVRCLKVSPDGRHLASGHRSGNIIIRDLASQLDIVKIEAHDSEVLCLEFSDPNWPSSSGKYLLCSSSRDRLIHLFDVAAKYSFVTTLDDHNSAITAVKFVPLEESLQLLSCGADKSVMFRKMITSVDDLDDQRRKSVTFSREHHVQAKTTLYDMEVQMEKATILTACQDRQIRAYNVHSGKMTATMKGSMSEEGTLIKLTLDPSGQFIATSSTDKSVNILDAQTGDVMASASGHSEPITGLKFTQNGRSLLTVSGDGCIFVWKLPPEVANVISTKLGLPPVPPEKPIFISGLRMDNVPPRNSPTSPQITITKWTPKGPVVMRPSIEGVGGSPPETDHESEKKQEELDSMKTTNSSSSDGHVVYYPADDDDSYQKSSFEVKVEKGLINGSRPGSSSSSRLQNSQSVPNFNDLNSEDEESVLDSSMTSPTVNTQKIHRLMNPLYMSSEQLNELPVSARNLTRSSLSTQHLKSSSQVVADDEDDVGGPTPTGRRREDLSRAVSQAKRRLQSLRGTSNNLQTSKSVHDLSFNPTPQRVRPLSTPSYTVPRSISMGDLSFGPRRTLGHQQQQLDVNVSAPVWDNHKSTENLSVVGLKKSTSISSLAKSQRLVPGGLKSPWGQPAPLSLTLGRNLRSGRQSAPLQRLNRMNGSIPGTQSSDDESSTEDDTSSSSFARTNLRPGTPPKPSLLRQVRRSSTSHSVLPNQMMSMPKMGHNHQGSTMSGMTRSRSRKLWDNNFELRSSKSEYNLNFMGLTPSSSGRNPISRSSSKVDLSSSFWENNRPAFSNLNPATIELTRENVEQVIEELNFMAIFVRKMYKRSQASPVTHGLADLLADGVSKAMSSLSTVVPIPPSPRLPPPSHSHHHHHLPMQQPMTPTLQNLTVSNQSQQPPVPMDLLVQYSDALLTMMQRRIQQQKGQQHQNHSNNNPSTDL